jgi:hypothetical protein
MKIKLSDIREATYDAYLDTEYREALAHSLMGLGYVSDSPLNLAMGTQKEKEEIERVERKALSSNQISEIIHLMMYEMRNDFQYGKFKPIALEFLNIEEKNKINNEIKEKPKCNIDNERGVMYDIICEVSKTLKDNKLFNESREMIERATTTYSYDEAFDIINEYVEIVEERENEEDEEFE